jgi:hypothetical protein
MLALRHTVNLAQGRLNKGNHQGRQDSDPSLEVPFFLEDGLRIEMTQHLSEALI